MSSSQKVKIENFKIQSDTSSQVNSGIVILVFGLILISIPLLQLIRFLQPVTASYYISIFGDLSQLGLLFGFMIVTVPNSFIFSAIAGWFIGGFISSILYGNEGKNGPLYASYILFRFLLGVLFLALLSSYLNAEESMLYLAISAAIFVISLPLILVASLSYRIGLWISPK